MTFELTMGWESLSQAAERLGLTRQGLHWRIQKGSVPSEFVRKASIGGRTVLLISPEYGEMKKEKDSK